MKHITTILLFLSAQFVCAQTTIEGTVHDKPLYGQRLKGSEQCGMGLNCCNASGPVVLARDERLKGAALEAILTPVVNENNYIDLTLKDHSDTGIWMVFGAKFIPESYAEYGAEPVETELCDYASAGNAMTVYPFFKVWMPQLYDPRK